MSLGTDAHSGKISEVRALTGVRGVAAIFVLLYHYQVYRLIGPAGHYWDRGYLAVDLFFSLSGFILALNYASIFSNGVRTEALRRFFSRRIARIYPLYLFTMLMAIAGTHRLPALVSSLLPNLLLIQNWIGLDSINGPSWSISAEWLAYLLFPFLIQGRLLQARWWRYALGMTSVALLIGVEMSSGHWSNPLRPMVYFKAPQSLLRCLAEFSLGILAYCGRNTKLWTAVKQRVWFAPALTLAILFLLALRGADLAIVLLFPVLVLSLYGRPTLVARLLSSPPIEYLGRLSFSIYLLHQIFLSTLIVIVRNHLHHKINLAILIALGCTAICAPLTYHFIEIPGRRLLRDRLEGTPPAPATNARAAR